MFQLRIINKYFWKFGILPISLLLNNLLIILVISLLYRGNIIALANILPTLTALPLMTIGITFVPTIMIELKSSSFFQRYLLYKNKNFYINYISFIFFIPVILVLYFLGFLVIALVNLENLDLIFSSVNWGELIFGAIITMFLSLFIGQMIFLYFNDLALSQTVGGVIFGIAVLLGGVVIPFSSIISIPFLNFITYLNPFRYSTGIMITAWFSNAPADSSIVMGGGAFNFNEAFALLEGRAYQEIFSIVDKALNISIPFVFMFIFFGFGTKKSLAKKFTKKKSWRFLKK